MMMLLHLLQTRSKLNMGYGGGGPTAEVTAGGNALKFYASVRLQVRKKEQLKRGDVVLFLYHISSGAIGS